jgi:hypothetical protein
MRTVRSANVLIPAARSAATERGWSQRSMSSPISGCGTGSEARVSSAWTMAVARLEPTCVRTFKQRGQVVAVSAARKVRHLATQAAQQAAGRLARAAPLTQNG